MSHGTFHMPRLNFIFWFVTERPNYELCQEFLQICRNKLSRSVRIWADDLPFPINHKVL